MEPGALGLREQRFAASYEGKSGKQNKSDELRREGSLHVVSGYASFI
jgi:hypothetical protein